MAFFLKGRSMGVFLGLLAGVGMLVLIAALIIRFLRQIGLLKESTCAALWDSGLTVLGIGCAYWAFGALMYQILYGNLDSLTHIEAIFRGSYMQRMFAALANPGGLLPLSAVSAWAGHIVGRLLFDHNTLGGMAFTWCILFLGTSLIRIRLEGTWSREETGGAVHLLLCLPGAVFLFLPGWPSIAFFLASLVFFFAGKKHKIPAPHFSPAVYGWAAAVCAVISAAVIAGCVHGRLG